MINDSLPLKLTQAQIPAIEKSISRQMRSYQDLLLLSCEMFKELYGLKPNHAFLERWHKIIQELLM